MKPETEGLDAAEVAILLGIAYERVLRYARELEAAGLMRCARGFHNRRIFMPADLETLRKFHESRVRAGDEEALQLHKEVLREMDRVHNLLVAMTRKVSVLVNRIRKSPPAISTVIRSVPFAGTRLKSPIPVVVEPLGGRDFRASAPDIGVEAMGKYSRGAAVRALRERIGAEFIFLRQKKKRTLEEEDRLQEIGRFIDLGPVSTKAKRGNGAGALRPHGRKTRKGG